MRLLGVDFDLTSSSSSLQFLELVVPRAWTPRLRLKAFHSKLEEAPLARRGGGRELASEECVKCPHHRGVNLGRKGLSVRWRVLFARK